MSLVKKLRDEVTACNPRPVRVYIRRAEFERMLEEIEHKTLPTALIGEVPYDVLDTYDMPWRLLFNGSVSTLTEARATEGLPQRSGDRRREEVDHPSHYGGEDNPYEVIKVLEAWLTPEQFSGFLRGTAIKYLPRAGKKDDLGTDLKKSQWYSNYEVEWRKRTGYAGT